MAKAKTQKAKEKPKEAHMPEPDFDDTIAHNRGLKLLDPASIPKTPEGYKPTNPEVRNQRLRRLANELRAEAILALDATSKRDLKKDLGKHAPDAKQASVIRDRLTQSAKLVSLATTLLRYAREMDEIARSDALIYLEAVNKEFLHVLDHEPGLVEHYEALKKLFDMRSGKIAEGIARARGTAAPEEDEEPAEE